MKKLLKRMLVKQLEQIVSVKGKDWCVADEVTGRYNYPINMIMLDLVSRMKYLFPWDGEDNLKAPPVVDELHQLAITMVRLIGPYCMQVHGHNEEEFFSTMVAVFEKNPKPTDLNNGSDYTAINYALFDTTIELCRIMASSSFPKQTVPSPYEKIRAVSDLINILDTFGGFSLNEIILNVIVAEVFERNKIENVVLEKDKRTLLQWVVTELRRKYVGDGDPEFEEVEKAILKIHQDKK